MSMNSSRAATSTPEIMPSHQQEEEGGILLGVLVFFSPRSLGLTRSCQRVSLNLTPHHEAEAEGHKHSNANVLLSI